MASSIALLIIDVQNDFVNDTVKGALAVPDGLAVVPHINALRATLNSCCVVLSQDWHPSDHSSFASNNPGSTLFSVVDLPQGPQVMWPDHCVQETYGSQFVKSLHRHTSDIVIKKGTKTGVDSYSAFGSAPAAHASSDLAFEKTDLEADLHAAGVKTVVICGLALDYCVSFTACDAAAAGFKTYVVLNATRGISPDSIDKEIGKMTAAGVIIVATMTDLPEYLLTGKVYSESDNFTQLLNLF